MAIRPVDLQGAIFQATQQQAAAQRQAEVTAQLAQSAAGQQVVKQSEERRETVQTLQQPEGNKVREKQVREKEESENPERRAPNKRERRPGEPFEALEGEFRAGAGDGEHLIDFTA